MQKRRTASERLRQCGVEWRRVNTAEKLMDDERVRVRQLRESVAKMNQLMSRGKQACVQEVLQSVVNERYGAPSVSA